MNTSAVTPDASDPVPRRRLVIGLLLLATLLVIGFWLVWFFVDRSMLATESRPACIEHATGRACC